MEKNGATHFQPKQDKQTREQTTETERQRAGQLRGGKQTKRTADKTKHSTPHNSAGRREALTVAKTDRSTTIINCNEGWSGWEGGSCSRIELGDSLVQQCGWKAEQHSNIERTTENGPSVLREAVCGAQVILTITLHSQLQEESGRKKIDKAVRSERKRGGERRKIGVLTFLKQ